MTSRQRAGALIEKMRQAYPDAECSLRYESAWQLLFATRLAAQCTDARVNLITPVLYERYPTLEALAESDIDELCEIVRPCGFYRHKARDIRECAARLIANYDGVVPDNMDELLTLPGVGRKTANLILGDVYGKPGIVADTHCIRLANRIGLVSTRDAHKVEIELSRIVPEGERGELCHRLVMHGRAVCTARSPSCEKCVLSDFCKMVGVKNG